MSMTPQDIKNLLTQAFPDSRIILEDLAGDGDHYAVRIVSPAFSGKSRIDRHKMVYSSLKGKMGNELHALALKTLTPKEDT